MTGSSDLHQHFTINEHGRDFVVGDIHGEYTKLRSKLAEVGFNGAVDRLFSVGDLVDRGPRSMDAVQWLQEPWFHAVRGNHENLTINAYRGNEGDRRLHAMNGGAWFTARTPIERHEIVTLFDALPYAISVDTRQGSVGIVHAEVLHDTWDGFLNDLDNERTQMSTIWGRYRHTYRDDRVVKGIGRIYVGHTVILPEHVQVLGNHHYIDTGGVFDGGFLTMVQL